VPGVETRPVRRGQVVQSAALEDVAVAAHAEGVGDVVPAAAVDVELLDLPDDRRTELVVSLTLGSTVSPV